MRQPKFSDIEYSLRKRTTKREEFLRAMDDFIPWGEWVAYIEPYYPGGQRGRPAGFVNWEKRIERSKSSVRSKVEHPFLILKRFFGFAKTVYRGLAKNTHRLHTLFASVNLLMCVRAGRPLRPAQGYLRPFFKDRARKEAKRHFFAQNIADF